MSDLSIEPVRIAPNLIYFYWGRHPEHENIDMKLGGGAYVIFEGVEAIAIDSMNLPGQGEWVRAYMQEHHGIEHFRLVNTHWHEDHIGCNSVYSDCTIIGHRKTRELMLQHKETLEAGSREGVPPFKVVPPDVTFSGRLDVYCGHTEVQLHEFTIHEHGHLAVYLPSQKILLAADMLEDPIWIFQFDFAAPAIQIAEFERMAQMDIERLYPTHGDLDTIRKGGYSKAFITHSINYLNRMIAAGGDKDFVSREAQHFIADELAAGELHWWGPYALVHEINQKTIAKLKSGK